MYIVYINLEKKAVCDTPDEVWKVIGKAPFGSLYEVVPGKPGVSVDEFIPF